MWNPLETMLCSSTNYSKKQKDIDKYKGKSDKRLSELFDLAVIQRKKVGNHNP